MSETSPATRRGLQFSLTALLFLMLLMAVFFAGLGIGLNRSRVEAERARAEALRAMAMEAQARDLAEVQRAYAVRALADKGFVPSDSGPIAEIESMLTEQAEAWNRGDLDSFMQHYWESDDLTFSSGGKTTRGFDATIARYREKYPTREKMGQLEFSQLEISPLGATAALVLGRWQLTRDDGTPGGNFSLVVRLIDDRWQIVHDHTSLTPAE